MSNEPVAWMVYTQDGQSCYVTDNPADISPTQRALPLYTDPVPTDEALLRQALEALSRARQTAMEQTLKARIPECAEFAGIAQDLDFVVAALRERLGVKA
jgi:hypothetical protein